MIVSAADYGLDITVWDRALKRAAPIPHFRSVDGTIRHLAAGTLDLVLDDDERATKALQTPGARLVVRLDDLHFHSGPIVSRGGSLLSGDSVRYTAGDDFSILSRTLAWIVPGGPIAPKSLDDPAQAVVTGTLRRGTVEGQSGVMAWPQARMPVETAVKWLLGVNLVQRLGLPVQIRDDQRRGGTVTLPAVGRFATLEETVVPILDAAGLGLRVWFEPESPLINVDIYESEEYPQVIDAESGIIVKGTWNLDAPTATRVVVGGPGEDAARAFAEYRDDTGLESAWGFVAETFTSATGASPDWPKDLDDAEKVEKYASLRGDVAAESKTELATALESAGAKHLAEGRPTAGVAAELMEAGSFYYGIRDGIRGFLRGDRVAIQAGAGEPIRDRITEVHLEVPEGGGRTVTPTVGGFVDDPDREIHDAIGALAASNARREKST
ncbi:ReqiPepy6 Gp37-like protein [Rathayibacter sp. PhB151]|uniref:Gp37-like protein n=1 Tax=Rathayibacter sp. PhB151 TaxID=2485189 RepID=UPI0010E3D5EF|nr:hypothetical protein [Rathayibacter sp. PhB151]TDX78728.1 ReqiPepy6 Gp37-like protein [Rathayibacter sp. PhB151]